MSWDDLKFVLAVGRAGTLAAAARLLNVDATTVGRRILAIEADLGARLFERTGAGYLPTHAGHKALSHAETMELTALSLCHQIEGSDRNVEGPLRLTGLDAIFDALIIARLPQLLARHPGLEITFSSNLELLELSRREADIALRNREPTHPDSVGRRLGPVAQAAYAAAGLQLGEAPPLIALPRENDGSAFSKMQRDLFPNGRIAARGNSEGHILALTRAGIGIGILDCFVGDSDPSLRRVLPDPVASQIVWAESHVSMARAPRVRAVIDFLCEIFARDSNLLQGHHPLRPEQKDSF
jgi:DNA-binding transcriptional LysR family regulator